MYTDYAKIRDSQGLTDTMVSRATGIARSNFTEWKMGRCEPKADKLIKIADFLHVSVNALMGEEEKTLPNMTREEALEYAFRGEPGMKMLFSAAEGATAEEILQVVEIMKVLRKKNG